MEVKELIDHLTDLAEKGEKEVTGTLVTKSNENCGHGTIVSIDGYGYNDTECWGL